jgi:hypothetical protein
MDLHLENRGITVIKDNKMALSTLSSVIKSFVNDGKDITIIVNTSFPDEFDESCFFKYLEFKTNPIIKKEEKSAEVSVLHNNAKDIVAQAHQEILRNVVIREAIEIENLIYIKVQENFTSITPELSISLPSLTKLLMTDDNVDNAILLSFITVIPLFSKCKSKEIYFKF